MHRQVLKTLLLTSGFAVIFISKTNGTGPGAGYTNAPSESNCATSGCHSGGLTTSGTPYNRLTLKMSLTGNGYIPDSTYDFVLHHKESGMASSGFQIVCLAESTSKNAGTFSNPDSRTQTMSLTVNSDQRSYLGHTGSSTSSGDSSSYKVRWKAPSSNVGNVRFYVTFNKGNGQSNTTGDVIYAKTWSVAPSSLLPTAKAKIKDALYCTNVNITFGTTTTGNPTSWRWEFLDIGTNPIVKTDSAPVQAFTTIKKYRVVVSVKNNKGASKTDTLSFTPIAGAGNPVLTPSTTTQICNGDSLQLSCNSLAGHSYLWSHGPTTRITKVADSGNYSVQVTAPNGCKRTSAATKVIVNQLPGVQILKSFSGDTICSNVPFKLGALVTSGTADSFSYTSKGGPYQKADSLNQSLASGSATYSVYAKNSKGCVSKPSSVTIHAKAKSTGPALSSSNITFTGFTVNWTALSGATGYKVSVDSGKTFITPSSGSTGLSHDVTGLLGNKSLNVLVYATTNGLCNQSEISNITVKTKSCTPIDYTITPEKTAVCKNGQIKVVLGKLKGMKIGIQVNGVFKGTDTIQFVTVTSSGNYDFSVIDSNALLCGYTTQPAIAFTVLEVGTPVMSPSTPFTACSNTTAAMPVTIGADANIDSIFYYQNNVLKSAGKLFSHTYTVANGDSVWAIAKNASGCVSPAGNKRKATVTPLPNSGFTTSNVQFSYTFTATNGNGTQKWKVGNDSSDIANPTFDLTSFKNDSATVEHTVTENGCSSTTKLKVFVPDFSGIKVKTIPGARLYPNPAAEILNIYLPQVKTTASIEIYNHVGQLVLAGNLLQGNNVLATDMLPAGVYQFKIMADKKETTGSIIMER